MTGAEGAEISGITLTAHPHRGRSCSWVCVTWSVTFPHPVLHIPFMWNAGQALHLGSTGDEGRSTPASLALRVMSLIAPACRKRPHLSSTYALLYAMALGRSYSLALPPPGTPPPRTEFAPTPRPSLRLAGSVFEVGTTVVVAVTAEAAEVSDGDHWAMWLGPRVGRELIPPA